jgi:hypothetical protein
MKICVVVKHRAALRAMRDNRTSLFAGFTDKQPERRARALKALAPALRLGLVDKAVIVKSTT